jgi:uncharacterized protein (TIGR03382 family)
MTHVSPAGAESYAALPPSTQASSRAGSYLPDLLLTLPFLLLFWLNLAHHELWLDELNAWGLSAASPTLKALFANVHYEGHPWLWYFILWIPSRFTHAPVAMKCLEAFIGAAIYLTIGLLSPFTRPLKVLLFLNYFVVFEYTVISRTYGLMLLFALLYIWRRAERPRSLLINMALLGALANTDVTGILLSGALLLEYCVSLVPQRQEIERRRAISALLLYSSMLLLSVHSLIPAPDISWFTTGHMFAKAASFPHLSHSIGDVIVAPWLPFANDYPTHFWNTDVAFHRGAVGLVPVILAVFYWTFRRRRSLLLLVGVTVFFAVTFSHLIYLGYPRHWGVTVLAFLLALWILCHERADRRTLSRVAYFLLLVSSIKGVAAIAASWTHPFSEAGNVARWLREQHLDQEPIAGSTDYGLAGVAESLRRPVYFLDCNCTDTYMKFSHRRDGLTPDQIPARIARAYQALRTDRLILVMGAPLTDAAVLELAGRDLHVKPLIRFTGSEDTLEYYLYDVRQDDASPMLSPR